MNIINHFVCVPLGTPGVATRCLHMIIGVMTAAALHVGKLKTIRCYDPRFPQELTLGLGGLAA